MSTPREIIYHALLMSLGKNIDKGADTIIAALESSGFQIMRVDPIKRPFSCDDVEQLAKHQTNRMYHPFTCQNRGDGNHRNAYGDLGALVATVRGWVCPFCDYTQDWAHGFMKAAPRLPAPPAKLGD